MPLRWHDYLYLDVLARTYLLPRPFPVLLNTRSTKSIKSRWAVRGIHQSIHNILYALMSDVIGDIQLPLIGGHSEPGQTFLVA